MKLVATMMLLVLASAASANGGLSIDTVDKHSNVSSYVSLDTIKVDVRKLAHGPIDAFINDSYKSEVAEIDDVNKLADF